MLNLITLEVSGTRLAEQIQSPRFVRQVDWIDRVWIGKSGDEEDPQHGSRPPRRRRPGSYRKGGMSSTFPQVQLYCLMSVAGSFTDFHVDFGGTAVWYHLLRGEKVFFLAPPSPENLRTFSTWTFDSGTFLPELSPGTFSRFTLRAGETLIIPSGWIHAVLTPTDSIVLTDCI